MPWVLRTCEDFCACETVMSSLSGGLARRGRRALGALPAQIRLISHCEPFFERRFRPPPHRDQPRRIHQLARRAVRLARVETDMALEADHAHDDLGQLADAHVMADADVD